MNNQDFSSANNFHWYKGSVLFEALPDNDYLTEVYRSFLRFFRKIFEENLKFEHVYTPTTFILVGPTILIT
jgi:hypothetical protein